MSAVAKLKGEARAWQTGGAIIDGEYRYLLWREWDATEENVLWIMLNPSTADGECDDPTIRRCIGFARSWGYGRIDVVNLFALRSTDPRALQTHVAPVGPRNYEFIIRAAKEADLIVCAWGAHGSFGQQDVAVRRLLGSLSHRLTCLRMTNKGQPYHPLYLPRDVEPLTMEPLR